jgi:hypothetical protein
MCPNLYRRFADIAVTAFVLGAVLPNREVCKLGTQQREIATYTLLSTASQRSSPSTTPN